MEIGSGTNKCEAMKYEQKLSICNDMLQIIDFFGASISGDFYFSDFAGSLLFNMKMKLLVKIQ